MPSYDYYCEANGTRLEVSHKMDRVVATWGELCELVGQDPGQTPPATPVRKLISAAAVVSSRALANPEPACAAGGCCPGGRCGL